MTWCQGPRSAAHRVSRLDPARAECSAAIGAAWETVNDPDDDERCHFCVLGTLHDGHPELVYYFAIGDLVKIGCTTSLGQRARVHSVSGGRLLAVEPGGLDVEADRHRRFLCVRGERFRATAELFAFIATSERMVYRSLSAWFPQETTRQGDAA